MTSVPEYIHHLNVDNGVRVIALALSFNQVGRLRGVAETLRANTDVAQRAHREAQEQVGELVAQLSAAREAERKEREAASAATSLLAAAKMELQNMRETPPPPPDPRLDELRQELTLLRTQNKCK